MSEHKEIEIKICCGTNCYITGGSDLHSITNYLPEEIASHTRVKGSLCEDRCTDFLKTKAAPFAWVNNKIIEGATIDKIKALVFDSWENR